MNDDPDQELPSPPDHPLRKGWTTGACATAAAKAAYGALLSGRFDDPVTINLPKGLQPTFPLQRRDLGEGAATASVIKDAGDDPDITHGAEIVATVTAGAVGAGVTFRAGPGVGTVTLSGLALPVGEPAINPAPRRMIAAELAAVAAAHGVAADVQVTLSVPGGETLAQETLNPRLGILGGLSILGTTGVVVPYSLSAWAATIQRGIDVALAAGVTQIGAATGKTSEAALVAKHALPEIALIEMGDMADVLFKYLRHRPVERLVLAGGFAKIAKLSQGHLDLHSARSRLDMVQLAHLAAMSGAEGIAADAIAMAPTGKAALDYALSQGIKLGEAVAANALEVARMNLRPGTRIEILVVDRDGQIVGCAHG